MANQFSSTSNETALLKRLFEGGVVSQFNDMIPFYKHIEKGTGKFAGEMVVRNVKVRRNPGIGATAEGGTLPKIGKQTTQQAQIQMKNNYLRCGLTANMMLASRGDNAAFAEALAFEMKEGLNDAKQNFNRQLFWDGTADLAVVGANVVASTAMTVTGRSTGEDGDKYLDVGLVIDIYTSAGVLVASQVAITAVVSGATATLTLDSPVTATAGDIVVMANSFNQEVQGILYSMDGATSTIYNINRSTYPVFQGNVRSAAGAQLTKNLMKQAWNDGKQKGGASYDAVFCDYDSERFYEKLLISDQRFINKVKGDGTFASKDESYLEYAGIPIVPDKDCPQQFLFLDSKTWKKYVLAEWKWADESGSNLIPQSESDVFEARLRHISNLFCEKPRGNSRLHTYISP